MAAKERHKLPFKNYSTVMQARVKKAPTLWKHIDKVKHNKMSLAMTTC